MNIVKGNIWDYEDTHLIVIPTNIGWNESNNAIMGAGLAKEARDRYPNLPSWYGMICLSLWENTPVVQHPSYPLILLPTKSLCKRYPNSSWRFCSDVDLIHKSLKQLSASYGYSDTPRVALPFLGCGNGKLKREDVLPLMETYLIGDRFLIVDNGEDTR